MTLVSANDKTIQLRDGRILGYAEYGSPAGKDLFYFHGHPGSRLEAGFLVDQAAQANVRLIGVDRPGMGLSSFKANRHIVDWPDDVVELADHLELDRFAVVGFSGGGPYALACAYKIHKRLTTCGIVAGVGHVNPFVSFLSKWLPWLLLSRSRQLFQNQEQAEKSLEQFAEKWTGPDRKAISIPGVSKIMAASLVDALRPGIRGAAYDGMLLGKRNWGFRLEEISFPNIYLWHGALDEQVSISSARAIAEKLVHCEASYYPDEGHISLIINHTQDILNVLAQAGNPR